MKRNAWLLVAAMSVASTTIMPLGAQSMAASRVGIAPPATRERTIDRDALQQRRRGGWEVGAAFGAVAGVTVGYLIVVNYDDGRAVKMGTGRRAATLVGSAALGAALGALVQTILRSL